jgi:hypothetical protein
VINAIDTEKLQKVDQRSGLNFALSGQGVRCPGETPTLDCDITALLLRSQLLCFRLSPPNLLDARPFSGYCSLKSLPLSQQFCQLGIFIEKPSKE